MDTLQPLSKLSLSKAKSMNANKNSEIEIVMNNVGPEKGIRGNQN
jgi:hypothetical protein